MSESTGCSLDTEHDTLRVSTPAVVSIASPTKRQIAFNVAKMFDLLAGLVYSSSSGIQDTSAQLVEVRNDLG